MMVPNMSSGPSSWSAAPQPTLSGPFFFPSLDFQATVTSFLTAQDPSGFFSFLSRAPYFGWLPRCSRLLTCPCPSILDWPARMKTLTFPFATAGGAKRKKPRPRKKTVIENFFTRGTPRFRGKASRPRIRQAGRKQAYTPSAPRSTMLPRVTGYSFSLTCPGDIR